MKTTLWPHSGFFNEMSNERPPFGYYSVYIMQVTVVHKRGLSPSAVAIVGMLKNYL